MFRPAPDVREQHNPEKSQKRKPGEIGLSLGKHESGEKRSERGTRVAADLEKRLRHAMLSAGSHARNAGRFRVEYRGADAHERRGGENCAEARSHCKSQQTNQCNSHAYGKGIRLRAAVGIKADERLEDGGGHLRYERDQTHLTEIQMEGVLQERVDRRDQRLQRIVQEVAKADGQKNFEDGFLARVCRSGCWNGRQVWVASNGEPEYRKQWLKAAMFLPCRRSKAARDVFGDVGVKKIIQAIADRAGSGDVVAGDFPGADEIAVRGRDKHFVGGVKVLGMKRLLDDGNAGLRRYFHEDATSDAFEAPGVERGREDFSVFHGEDIGGGAFGNFAALVQHDHFVETIFDSFANGPNIIQP